MNCLRCNTPNEEGAKFCRNCGMDLSYTPSKENANSKYADTLLIIFICIAFISAIAQFAIQKLVDNWYESPTIYIQGSLWILQNLSFILIPLSMKNKNLKIVGIIITVIMVIYWVYTNVEFMTR
jgi:hypothetical protein